MAFLDSFASRYNRTIEILSLTETTNSIGTRTPSWSITESDVRCFISPNSSSKESWHKKIGTTYDSIVSQYTCRLGLDHIVQLDDKVRDDGGTLYTVVHIRVVSGFGNDDHKMLYLNEVTENV